jgi:2,3-bisphosphoglycerate-dependent phosphoglycerate mutase
MGSLQGQAIGRSRQPGGLPSDIEPSQAFSTRAHSWWRDTILPYATKSKSESDPPLADEHEPANILVVSHGGLMHVMVQNLIESRKIKVGKETKFDKFRFPNASVSVIELERSGKGTLVMFADTTHLDLELVDANADIIDEGQ